MTSRIARLGAAALTAISLTAIGLPAAHAAPAAEVDTWGALPPEVTSAQQVWMPGKRLGMALHSTTRITAEQCGTGSTYVIEALYGNGTAVKPAPSFDISQTAGDCDLEPHTYFGKVKTITTKHGRFVISAGCGWDARNDKPVAGYDGGPCKQADVKTKGGLITLQGNGNGTKVQVESSGLTYGQLVAIAKGLKPLS